MGASVKGSLSLVVFYSWGYDYYSSVRVLLFMLSPALCSYCGVSVVLVSINRAARSFGGLCEGKRPVGPLYGPSNGATYRPLLVNSRINVDKASVVSNSIRRTLSCKTGAFVLCANTPRGAQHGPISRLYVPRTRRQVHRGGVAQFIIRTPCVVGLTGAMGPRIFSLTISFLTGRVRQARTVNDSILVLRPNSRINTKASTKVRRVVRNLGRILSRPSPIHVTLRAVTNGNSRVNGHFRRLTTVCSNIHFPSQLHIYFSAYRIRSTKCSLATGPSLILSRFSGALNGSRVTIFRVGSDGGRGKTTGSQRTGLNINRVKFTPLCRVIRRPSFLAVPGVLRAP